MKLAILTDIHEDIASLKAVVRKIEKQNCDEIICLGDISGFSARFYDYYRARNAHECLSVLKENCKVIIVGNHDMHAAKMLPRNCTFFDFPENWYELDYHERHKLSNDILWLHEEDDLNPLYKKSDIEYLRQLPEYSVFKTPECTILFSHYIFPNLSGLKKEFYTYKNEFRQHFEFMQRQDCTISFTGHSHIKGCFSVTKKKYKTRGYKSFKIENEPVCVGIPPITALQKKSGFCIFDCKEKSVQIIKQK